MKDKKEVKEIKFVGATPEQVKKLIDPNKILWDEINSTMDPAIIKFSIDNGADPAYKVENVSIISRAAYYAQAELVQDLLNCGKKICALDLSDALRSVIDSRATFHKENIEDKYDDDKYYREIINMISSKIQC